MQLNASHLQAAIATLTTAAIIVFMDWVRTPLNHNIEAIPPGQRLPSTIVHGVVGGFFGIANALVWKWAVFVGALWFTVVLARALVNWWLPYLFGIHRGEISPESYRRDYGRNVTWLPQIKDHPVIPDVQHTVIHLSLLATAVLSWLSFVHA